MPKSALPIPLRFNAASTATISDDNHTLSYSEFNQCISEYHNTLAEMTLTERKLTETVLVSIEQSVHYLALMLACFGQKKGFIFFASTGKIPDRLSACDRICLDQDNNISLVTHKQIDTQTDKSASQLADQSLAMSGKLGFLSSGSVGDPKVILHQAPSLIANSQNARHLLPLSDEDKVLIPVPISHMYGFGAAALTSLCSGASLQLTLGLNLLKWRKIENTCHPSCVFFTPSLLDAISAKISYQHTLKFIVTAGDCVNTRYLRTWADKTQYWLNLYGSTELGVIGIASLLHDDLLNEATEKIEFTPCNNVHVYCQDEQLHIVHPHAFVGYLNQCVSLSPFKTGDLGHVESNGRFSVNGRADFSVNREGRLLAFAQLEMELKKHASVENVVLVPGPKDSKGKTLIACCEGVSEEQLITLKQTWRRHLPAYAVPSELKIVDPLPRLANGKLNRKKLEEVITHV